MPTETATLGGGCFWCIEPIFDDLQGVTDVVSGYAGGQVSNPTYRQVCSGTTGHAEVINVTFNPSVISYHEILEVFFSTHDPTTRDRQGADTGTQYRSIILTHTPEQQRTAAQVTRELDAQGIFDAPIVTQIEPLDVFYPAEAEHQEYYQNNSGQGYCRVVIAPKVAKFRQKYANRTKTSQEAAHDQAHRTDRHHL